MKNSKYTQRFLILAALTVLAPLSWAQVSGAVNSATGAAAGAAAQRPINPPAPPAAAVSAGAQAGAQGAAGAATRPAAGAAAATHRSATSVTATGARDGGVGINGNAGTNAATGAQVNGATVGGAAAGEVGVALNTADTTTQIRQSGRETRDKLASSIDASIDIAQATGERLERSAKRLEAGAKARYQAAVDEVRVREKALKASLHDARKATAEEWTQAREKLAADYEAFTRAIANAEASVGSASASGSGVIDASAGAK